jgi:hypothetical protein
MSKFNIDNDGVKKVLGIVMAVGTGVLAVINTLADQKKAQEFEDMKKTLSELQNKN